MQSEVRACMRVCEHAFANLLPTHMQAKDPKHFKDKETGQDLEVVERMPMLEWLANNYKKFGCNLDFITNKWVHILCSHWLIVHVYACACLCMHARTHAATRGASLHLYRCACVCAPL